MKSKLTERKKEKQIKLTLRTANNETTDLQ